MTRVTRLSLENFRNYDKIEVAINSDLVLILGPNASGKTNLLEAVYYLARLKSFRSEDRLVVKTGSDYFRLAAQADQELEIAVQIRPTLKRSFKLDGQKLTRLNWAPFATILFEAGDL